MDNALAHSLDGLDEYSSELNSTQCMFLLNNNKLIITSGLRGTECFKRWYRGAFYKILSLVKLMWT